MFRNRRDGRGFGRGAGLGYRAGRGQGYADGAGFGRGRRFGLGQERGFLNITPPGFLGRGFRQNLPLSELSAEIPLAEKKSWLENFKAHLSQRMAEVDEELKKY